MILKVGNTYLVKEIEGEQVHTFEVIQKSKSGKSFRVKVLASNCFFEGEILGICMDENFVEGYSWALVEGEPASDYEIEKSIVLNSELKIIFIDLALATNDKEWFNSLSKKVVVDR